MGAEPARRPVAEAAARRTLEAGQRVRSALWEAAAVRFAAVASRAFLDARAELDAEIEALRTRQASAPARLRVRQRASGASVRARLRAALDESQRRRWEIARLGEGLAHGRVRGLELDRRVRRA